MVAAIPPIAAMVGMTVVRSGSFYDSSKIPGFARLWLWRLHRIIRPNTSLYVSPGSMGVDKRLYPALAFVNRFVAAVFSFISSPEDAGRFCLFCGVNKCASSSYSLSSSVEKLICLIAHFSVTCPAGLFFTSIYLKLLCCRPLALCDRITVAASAPRY